MASAQQAVLQLCACCMVFSWTIGYGESCISASKSVWTASFGDSLWALLPPTISLCIVSKYARTGLNCAGIGSSCSSQLDRDMFPKSVEMHLDEIFAAA